MGVRIVSSCAAFQPDEVRALSEALDDICRELGIEENDAVRETVAVRVIELASHGERVAARLRDQILGDADGPLTRPGSRSRATAR